MPSLVDVEPSPSITEVASAWAKCTNDDVTLPFLGDFIRSVGEMFSYLVSEQDAIQAEQIRVRGHVPHEYIPLLT
jgi:hypothetical protein